MNTSVFISEESAHLRHIHHLFPDSCCPNRIRPTLISMYTYVQPIIAIVISITIGMDALTWQMILAAAIIMLSSCGASHYLTTNANLQQTNVVLSQNNFHVVKNVESSVTAKYWFGIGGISNKANIWSLNKIDGLNTTLNILSIIADAEEDVRPDVNDYSIIVQLGADDAVSYVRVMYYKDETYHKLLAFMKTNCKDIIEVSSGKIVKHQATKQAKCDEKGMKKQNVEDLM